MGRRNTKLDVHLQESQKLKSFAWLSGPENRSEGQFYVPLQDGRDEGIGLWSSLKLRRGEAALRKPSGMAPAGEGRRASIVVLSARVRLRNRTDDFLGKWRGRSDLPV
jgi:hypothetical protein